MSRVCVSLTALGSIWPAAGMQDVTGYGVHSVWQEPSPTCTPLYQHPVQTFNKEMHQFVLT